MARESKSPIRVANFVNGKCDINLREIAQLLKQPAYKDKKIAVISAFGSSREGKSFLLNFILMRMRALAGKGNASNWMKIEGLNAFKYSNGNDPVTMGINIWPEPFIVKDDNGEDLVVLVMDTQGVFGSDTTGTDCGSIIALTALLSSHMIFNRMGKFEESQFQYLNLALEFAKMLHDADSQRKCFQGLTFLVRDHYLTSDYGRAGGRIFLEQCVRVNPKQSSEAQTVRARIFESFESIDAFLLPNPGPKVARNDIKAMSDIDEEFLRHLRDLIEKLPLEPKNGEKTMYMTCGEWIERFEAFGTVLERDGAFEVKTIYQTTCDLSAALAIEKVVNHFKLELRTAVGARNTEEYIESVITKAMTKLEKSKIIGGATKEHKTKLRSALDEIIANTRRELELADAQAEKDEFDQEMRKQIRELERTRQQLEQLRPQLELQLELQKLQQEAELLRQRREFEDRIRRMEERERQDQERRDREKEEEKKRAEQELRERIQQGELPRPWCGTPDILNRPSLGRPQPPNDCRLM